MPMYRCTRCKETIWGKISKHHCFIESAARDTDGYVTVTDAAKIAKVDPQAIYYALKNKVLRKYELRGIYYVSLPELERWMQLRPVDESPASDEVADPPSMAVAEPAATQLDDGTDSLDTSIVPESSYTTDSLDSCGENL